MPVACAAHMCPHSCNATEIRMPSANNANPTANTISSPALLRSAATRHSAHARPAGREHPTTLSVRHPVTGPVCQGPPTPAWRYAHGRGPPSGADESGRVLACPAVGGEHVLDGLRLGGPAVGGLHRAGHGAHDLREPDATGQIGRAHV